MAYSATCCVHMGPLQAPISTVLLLASMVVVVGSSSAREAPSSSVKSFELIHVVDANNGIGGFTKDDDELARSADDTYLTTARYSHKEYLMELKIGTPPTSFKAVADTGSGVIWTKRMELCNPSAKSSFASKACPPNGQAPGNKYHCNQCGEAGQNCEFKMTYGGSGMHMDVVMADGMLTLSRTDGGPNKEKTVPISFSCANRCHDHHVDFDCSRLIPKSADGIVGLNRGPNSLLTQLGATRFSYCLSSPESEQSSPLWFGGGDLELRNPPWWFFWEAIVHTTPLVKKAHVASTSVWAYKYYIELEGISVGKAPWEKVPKFNHESLGGNKGVIMVDSGTSYSCLESAAFGVLVDLLQQHLKLKADQIYHKPTSRTKKNGYSEACFPATQRPDLVLHFTGGAQMRLPWSTYMSEVNTKEGEKSGSFCTAIVNSSQDISILGNPQQQNMHMLFDLHEGAEKLSFVQVSDCSKPEL